MKSLSFLEETGYSVLSGNVIAFKNVCMLPFNSSTNGSLTGYFLDPFKTECSRIWNTPVSFSGIVLNAIANVLFSSARSSQASFAPVLTCCISYNVPFTSLNSVIFLISNPLITSFIIISIPSHVFYFIMDCFLFLLF